MEYLRSDKQIQRKYQNVAWLIKDICSQYKNKPVFCFKKNEQYQSVEYALLYQHVCSVANNLIKTGFNKGNKLIIFSPNCYEMLVAELAVMALGGVVVPVFAYFKKEVANLLINFCDGEYLLIHGNYQFLQLSDIPKIKHIFYIDNDFIPDKTQDIPIASFQELMQEKTISDKGLNFHLNENDICLNMYTSGTMGIPKCVQLTHKNILSQQDALSMIWNVSSQDRFLSYLPWHHSFGGIFELFTILYNGASYCLESSYGKEIQSIIENWKIVQPTVFFSVPKVHKALTEHISTDPKFEKILFHPEFKFIFTAAAPLSDNVANEYQKRNIKILEGWGLTETSPCCTISEFNDQKEIGVVGFPIPGVSVRIDNEGEIQVKGDNVMYGYYKNEKANEDVFTDDGWFKTGDVGEITKYGLKLISRKDRIFKLSNGEKIIPTDIEKVIEKKCFYIAYIIIYGSSKEYPVALIFPNRKYFVHPPYNKTPEGGCFCPRSLNELGKCLHGCLNDVNNQIHQKFSKIKAAILINHELSIDDHTLTPSLKPSPKNIINKYLNKIQQIYENEITFDEDICLIILDEQIKNAMNYGGN